MACKQWLSIFGLFLALTASSVLHDGGADLSAPEACDAGDGTTDCAAQGDALLQHASRMDLGQAESMSEDAESTAESEASHASATVQTKEATISSMQAWLRSVLTDGVVRSAKARVAEDGDSAVVHFLHWGKTREYRLNRFSVYADTAEYLVHTDGGAEKRPLPLGRTFRARTEDNDHGLWASARLDEDGLVTGLFQVDDGVVRLEPLGQENDAEETAGLLQAAKEQGMQSPHVMRRVNISALLMRDVREKPCVKMDGECIHDGGDDGKDGIDHVPHMSPNADEKGLIDGTAAWNGVKWWPGCYSGDDKLQDFKMGAVCDHACFKEQNGKAAEMIQAAFAESSFIYEQQLHIKLSIGHLKIYESENGAPAYAKGCSPILKLSEFKSGAASDMPSGLGSSHIFTGCGTGYGTVGKAWVGTICRTDGYATGVNQFHKSKDWLTFAHELGHNFAGGHSFEEGQGKTGGIMDYGDGLLDGTYQFNTKYRKQEMCKKMNEKVNKCAGGFTLAKEAGPYAVLRSHLKDLKAEIKDTEDEMKKLQT